MNRLLLCISFCSTILISVGQTTQNYDTLKATTKIWFGKNIDSAFYYASQMLEESKKTKDVSLQSESILYQGLAYGYMNDFNNEAKYYKQAYTFAKNHNDTTGVAKALLNIGVNRFYSGKLDSATIYYKQALRLFEATNNKKFIASSLNNLGQVYSRLDKHEEASNAYKNSLKYKIETNDTIAIINTYFNITSLSLLKQDYEEALKFSKKTLIMAQALNDSVDIGEAYINMTLALTSLDSIDKAKYFLEQALAYRPAFKNKKTLLDLHSSAADLYMKKSEWPKVRFHLEKMQEYLRTDAFSKAQMKYYRISYEIEKMDGNFEKALSFLEKYHEVKDKYLSESVQKNVTELEKKYQTEQKELQITQLELESQKQTLKLEESRNQRNLFIFGFFIILLFTGFTYYRYRTKKKVSDLLTLKNSQITTALDEREILLKEIHHRVKNNLQVISSLLNLQAGSLDDAAAKEAISEGQARVKSMALIHQRLYSADDVRGVDVQDYLENLGKELFYAYGLDMQDFNFTVNTSNLKLDIDTVIPIGLIINELITNSIKYAFEGMKKGSLSIQMKEVDKTLNLIVLDNGRGFNDEELKKKNSFGWRMIHSLGRKLKAEITVDSSGGTKVELIFSRYKLI